MNYAFDLTQSIAKTNIYTSLTRPTFVYVESLVLIGQVSFRGEDFK
jgi:hypothetical protein